jgi:hypothetical protein
MDIVSKYTALLGQQKLKESFVRDLELVLSRKYPNIEKGKLNFIRYSEMKNWSVRELFGEDLEQADRALINKVYHMLFDIGSDFESVIRMLYSFRNGPKSGIRIITNGLTRTEMKNILLKISQKRILDGIGEDIPYQKNPLIK